MACTVCAQQLHRCPVCNAKIVNVTDETGRPTERAAKRPRQTTCDGPLHPLDGAAIKGIIHRDEPSLVTRVPDRNHRFDVVRFLHRAAVALWKRNRPPNDLLRSRMRSDHAARTVLVSDLDEAIQYVQRLYAPGDKPVPAGCHIGYVFAVAEQLRGTLYQDDAAPVIHFIVLRYLGDAKAFHEHGTAMRTLTTEAARDISSPAERPAFDAYLARYQRFEDEYRGIPGAPWDAAAYTAVVVARIFWDQIMLSLRAYCAAELTQIYDRITQAVAATDNMPPTGEHIDEWMDGVGREIRRALSLPDPWESTEDLFVLHD